MRRTASEVINDLENRIARLESKTAGATLTFSSEEGDVIEVRTMPELKKVLKGNACATRGNTFSFMTFDRVEFTCSMKSFTAFVAESCGSKTVIHLSGHSF